MDLKFLRRLLRGSLMRRVVLRAFMIVLALIVVSLLQISKEVRVLEPIMSNIDECSLDFASNPASNAAGFLSSASNFLSPLLVAYDQESQRLTKTLFKVLMEKNFLRSDARGLCVGDGSASIVMALHELGIFDAVGVELHPYFSLFKMRFMYETDFEDNHFDFVFSGDLDKVSVPSLLVMEIERVLRPGGTSVIIMEGHKFYLGRSSIPVASFLKGSDIVYTCGIGSLMVVIFKKKLQNFTCFEKFQLPAHCPSLANNKPFRKYLEPLTDKSLGRFDSKLSYLPYHMNISTRNKLVYINVGAGEFARASIAKMLKPYCSEHHKSLDVYVIDHRTSILASYMTDPGVTFIYDPTLSGVAAAQETTPDDYMSEPFDDEEFEFVPWFNEMVSDGDFVILMMNAKLAELNIIVDLFKTGAICHVDELFLGCSSDTTECTNILKSLRKSGVYAHHSSLVGTMSI